MLDLQAFGPLDLRSDETDLRPLLTQPKRLALLAYLVLARPRGYQRRDVLLALFWPELDQTRARKALSQSLFILRRALPDGVLLTRGAEEVGIDPEAIRCDAREFENALEAGRWADALSLYKGELLAGLHISSAPEFEQWLDPERERLRELAAGAAWSLARERIAAGKLVEAERVAQRALSLVPTDESPVRSFIETLAAAGDRAAALRFYEKFTGILAQELDVEPSSETAAVAEAVRTGDGRGGSVEEAVADGRAPGTGARVSAAGLQNGAVDSQARDAGAGPGAVDEQREPEDRQVRGEGRRRFSRWPWLAGVIAILAVAVTVALRSTSRDGVSTVPYRVAVLPFENETGDPGLDRLGPIASDWITGGLAELDTVQVVPTPTLLGILSQPDVSGDRLRWIAGVTGAGLIVSGSIILVGDSLEIRAQLLDPGGGRVLDALEPARTDRSNPTGALAPIRRQVMGCIALRLDDRVVGLASVTDIEPPSYDAYRAYIVGVELFFAGRYQEAIRELDRAQAADSGFRAPGIWIGSAFGSMGEPARKDSVVQLLEPHRAELSPIERSGLDIMRAQLRGDLAEVYRIARDGNRRQPTTESRLILGTAALALNRPGEAVQTLRAEPENGPTRARWLSYHSALTDGLHILCAYDEELEAAREARDRFPDELETRFWEARALIGLGHVDEATSVIDDAMTFPAGRWSPGYLLLQSGLELRYHGYGEEGERALRRGLEWYLESGRLAGASATGSGVGSERGVGQGSPESSGAGSDSGAGSGSAPGYRFSMARARFWLGEYGAAAELFRTLVEEMKGGREDGTGPEGGPALLEYEGYLALALSAAGHEAEAREIDARLATWPDPYVRGRHLYWRAAVAARLGERARAITLLRQALSEGVSYRTLHENEELRPLWDYAPFQDLLALKR